MAEHDQLRVLAALIAQRNAIDREISSIIGRPAHPGHIGEFVAARIFGIQLAESASQKGIDGHFARGWLAGKSVNVKKYSKGDSLLDVNPNAIPDFYLVLTGPRASAMSSRGSTHPWTIEVVFLFDGSALVQRLAMSGVKMGVATSVRRHLWDEAEIYPRPRNPDLRLTSEQISMIEMFGEPNVQVDS